MDNKRKLIISIGLLVLTLLMYIGMRYEVQWLMIPLSLLIIIWVWISFVKEALVRLRTCLAFMIFGAPILSGLCMSILTEFTKYNINHIAWYGLFVIFYLGIATFVILMGDIRVAKLATLIIAQLLSIAFLTINLGLNFIPVSMLKMIVKYPGTEVQSVFTEYGLDYRGFIEMAIQVICFPTFIVAILAYLIAELKEYQSYKKSRTPKCN